MMERTTVRLPETLLDRARKKAAAEGRTLTSLIEEGLGHVIAGPRPSAGSQTPKTSIRTSTATGGRNPEFAHLTFREIEEMEDGEKMQRLDQQIGQQLADGT